MKLKMLMLNQNRKNTKILSKFLYSFFMFSIILGGVLFFSGEAMATDYYVSSSAGADTNNGISPTTSFAHHPWDRIATNTADNTTLVAGDTVYMKKGDVWYNVYLTVEDSGSSDEPIITTTKSNFGAGNNPKLYGSYNPSTLSFEADGNSYKATGLTTEPNIVVYNDIILTENDGATSTVGSNEWDWNADNLWVNVGEDPDIGMLLAGKQNYVVLNTSGDYFTFENLEFRLANTTVGGTAFVSGRTGVTFSNCTFQYSPLYNLYLYQTIGATVSGCTLIHSNSPNNNLYINDDDSGTTVISNNTIRYGQTGIAIKNSSGCVINGNSVHDTTSYGISLSDDNNSVYSNTIYNGSIGITIGGNNCIINGNTIYNTTSSGIQILDADSNLVYSNTIQDIWDGNYYGSDGWGVGINISGSSELNEVYKNNIYGCYIGIMYSSNSGSGGDKIYSNIVRDSIVNDIDIEGDSGNNPIESYNNTILHNPSSNNNSPYTGHGLAAQNSATNIKFANNLVIVEPDYPSAPDNSQGICISNIVEALTDYNHVYLINTTYGYGWKYNGTQIRNLSSWQSSIQSDTKIKNLDGISNLAGANSQEGNSYITNLDNNDFTLQATSPSIDAGTDVSLTTDYSGNSIYGLPDIGAYEYQPPYTIGTDDVPTTGSIRIYSDGKYRTKTASSTADTAVFSITPVGGSYQATTTQYMDITLDSWLTSGTYNKQWTATSTEGDFLTQATTTVYTIGDLSANTYYQFKLDGVASSTAVTGSACNSNGSCLSDANGQSVFTYSGGYSTHTFALEKDVVGPASFSLSSPATDSFTSNSQPTLSWNATTDSESELSHYQLYIDSSLDTNNITTTSVTPTNYLSCGSHSWYVKAVDNAGNSTNSETFNLTMSCGGGLPLNFANSPSYPMPSSDNPQGGFRVLINNGLGTTNSRIVVLKFFVGSDTKKMAISEDINFKNASQYPFVAAKEYVLSEDKGIKTIYAKFYTKYGVASEIVSDSIILKTSLAELTKTNLEKNTTTEEEIKLITQIDKKLSKRMSGNILLQVEKNGEGWYVYPDNKKKYYLGRPADAFSIMRKLGLGATHEFITSNTTFPDHVLGKILLDVEQNGEAYYIYPKDKKAYYLGRPADAFNVMRDLGLGITNDNIRKIDVGEVE